MVVCARSVAHLRDALLRVLVVSLAPAADAANLLADLGRRTLAVVGRRPEDHEDELFFDFVEVMGLFRGHE